MFEDQGTADLGLLSLRSIAGGLMAGHGAQKLFGSFGGPGIHGTAGMTQAMGLQPAYPWAMLAALGEFGGGALTTLGLLHPIGPISTVGAMAMATVKAHWGKPIWVTSGGAELPVVNIAIATALMLTGPGAYSLDQALGIKLPRWVAFAGLAGVAATVAIGASMNPVPQPNEQDAPALEDQQGGQQSNHKELPTSEQSSEDAA